MNLEEMSMKSLLAVHNAIADAPAGPKTFATKGKLVARIESIAAARDFDVASFGRPEPVDAAEQRSEQQAGITKMAAETKKKRGVGVGELARRLLMAPAGYPHEFIATAVNAEIAGASATAKSIRWYACKMRKEGVQVPERKKTYPAETDAGRSTEWPKGIRPVVTSGGGK